MNEVMKKIGNLWKKGRLYVIYDKTATKPKTKNKKNKKNPIAQ